MICWRCKAKSDDSMPYWGFGMGAKWKTQLHKLGTFIKAQRVAGSIVSPLFTCLGFTLDLGGKLKDWYKEHNPTSQIQILGITQIQKRSDGSAH